ncbi:unnamed protein product [Prorocentrum cordatum]|uniref:Uncharacterized protein n=1 Tax=Prorocentrum cordatum TaxID=2364126 RepID=A0ABN9PMP0_9DINO|nr:unnamed protein product [Polarella glacialis]
MVSRRGAWPTSGRPSVARPWVPHRRYPYRKPPPYCMCFAAPLRETPSCLLPGAKKEWRLFEWQALYPAAPPRSGVLWDYYRASADGMCSAQPSGVAEEVLQVWHVVRGGLERGRNKLREWSMR